MGGRGGGYICDACDAWGRQEQRSGGCSEMDGYARQEQAGPRMLWHGTHGERECGVYGGGLLMSPHRRPAKTVWEEGEKEEGSSGNNTSPKH